MTVKEVLWYISVETMYRPNNFYHFVQDGQFYSPTIFICIEALPLFPMLSMTVQVCTPASRDLNMLSDIELEEELEAKQLLQVEDQR